MVKESKTLFILVMSVGVIIALIAVSQMAGFLDSPAAAFFDVNPTDLAQDRVIRGLEEYASDFPRGELTEKQRALIEYIERDR